jgi:hypothetical protein
MYSLWATIVATLLIGYLHSFGVMFLLLVQPLPPNPVSTEQEPSWIHCQTSYIVWGYVQKGRVHWEMTSYRWWGRNSCSKQCEDLQTGTQPYQYLPRIKWRPHPPAPPKPIHMVSSAMLVEGYRMRQQSAVVVSEYLPSFEMTQKTLTQDDLLCFYSPFTGDLCKMVWTFL